MEADEIIRKESVVELGIAFGPTEHKYIGDAVQLKLPNSGKTKNVISCDDALLRLPNGLELSFGQIIALAGDFYGVPEKPIIDPTENADKTPLRRERFMEAYATLANADKEELAKIVEVMKKEGGLIEAALEDKKRKKAVSDDDRIVPHQVYEEHEASLCKEWDQIMGGKWIGQVPIVFGRLMKLASSNYDHFMPSAKDAYLVGHELAREKAKEASKTEKDEEKLRLLHEAYSIDAFACHFLTDSFSSGHIRTPRRELAEQVTPSKAGHLLSKYMHDEDNRYGLRVTNKRGDKWVAYGDGMLLSDVGEDNYKIVIKAVQASVEEVYEAFEFPENPTSSSRVTDYIPFVDANEKNNFPMFQIREGKLLRRADLENLSDSNTIKDWIGLVTAIKLRSYKPRQSVVGEDDEVHGCRGGCGQRWHPELLPENTDDISQ